MKKIMLGLAMIAIAITMFAHNPVAPACALKKYPGLYTDWISHLDKDTLGIPMNEIIMTVPFSSVKKADTGKYYYITHPVLGNECSEITDLFHGSELGIEQIFEALDKRADKNELIATMTIAIRLVVYKDKPNTGWRIQAISIPKTLEIERYK